MSKSVTKKILPEYFRAVKSHQKTFELRKDEDNFEVGDTIRLAEFDGKQFTGNVVIRLITYILRDCPEYGLMPGYCILGIQSETEVLERKFRQEATTDVLDAIQAKEGGAMKNAINTPGLYCDDISFCPHKCNILKCPRNSINIRDRSVPHSYFVETPPDCPKECRHEKEHR